jgi:hypothetical protein
VAAAKQKADAVAYRWQRAYYKIQTGHYLTIKSKQRRKDVSVFFAQGSMDGACGLHVFAAVLIIFELAKHDALEDMSRRKYGVPAEVFSVFRHTFFEGIHARDFVDLVNNELKLPLSLTLRQATDGGLDKWAVDQLMLGELIAVTFASVKNRRTMHWALCVGCEGSTIGRKSQTDTILLLDPAGSEPSFQVANSRLCVPLTGVGSRGGKAAADLLKSKDAKPIDWLYQGPEWATEPMRLTAAVRFRLTDWS